MSYARCTSWNFLAALGSPCRRRWQQQYRQVVVSVFQLITCSSSSTSAAAHTAAIQLGAAPTWLVSGWYFFASW